MANGLSNCYHVEESTFICKGFKCDFKFLLKFSMKFLKANRIAPDGTPRFAASHLGLCCLPMSHKRTPGLNELRIVFSDKKELL